MKVIHARSGDTPSKQLGETFTGTVWMDPVKSFEEGVQINNVFFSPGARTHWHAHELGQVLHVTAGQGWVCKEGEAAQPIRAGDVVWIAPHERHWHGAASGSYMIHLATSIGITDWQDAVIETDYKSAG
jgi:quercetin dioxygenase-like cupin family protein